MFTVSYCIVLHLCCCVFHLSYLNGSGRVFFLLLVFCSQTSFVMMYVERDGTCLTCQCMNEFNNYANIVTILFLCACYYSTTLCTVAIQLSHGIRLNKWSQSEIFNSQTAVVSRWNPVNNRSQGFLHLLAERLLQALLALSPPDAFPHAFNIQVPRCIEHVFIKWCLVPMIKFFLFGLFFMGGQWNRPQSERRWQNDR